MVVQQPRQHWHLPLSQQQQQQQSHRPARHRHRQQQWAVSDRSSGSGSPLCSPLCCCRQGCRCCRCIQALGYHRRPAAHPAHPPVPSASRLGASTCGAHSSSSSSRGRVSGVARVLCPGHCRRCLVPPVSPAAVDLPDQLHVGDGQGDQQGRGPASAVAGHLSIAAHCCAHGRHLHAPVRPPAGQLEQQAGVCGACRGRHSSQDGRLLLCGAL
jgi:hypothetical protein